MTTTTARRCFLAAIATLGLGALAACKTGADEPRSTVAASSEPACTTAKRQATAAPFESLGRTWRCDSLHSVADKEHDPTGFGYTTVVKSPDACVVEVTRQGGNVEAFLVDRGNELAQSLTLRGGDFQDFWGRDSSWVVTGINNRFDQYRFDPKAMELDVDRQIIGFFRSNLYVFKAKCQLLEP
jgi:hypothetical protein